MWKTDPFLHLPKECRFQYIHSCMYGGKRRKSTAFLMNFEATNLMKECDDNHTHLPWGMVQNDNANELTFSTSLETEYPAGLCKQLVIAFAERLQQLDKHFSPAQVHMDQSQRVGAGIQPRGTRSPLLLGDFKFKIDVKSADTDVPAVITSDVQPPFQGIPVHSKLISSQVHCQMGENGEKKSFTKSTFGVFRQPFEFLERALELQHPLDNPCTVERGNLNAIFFIGDHSVADVMQYRAQQLKKYTQRAVDLMAEERKFK